MNDKERNDMWREYFKKLYNPGRQEEAWWLMIDWLILGGSEEIAWRCGSDKQAMT